MRRNPIIGHRSISVVLSTDVSKASNKIRRVNCDSLFARSGTQETQMSWVGNPTLANLNMCIFKHQINVQSGRYTQNNPGNRPAIRIDMFLEMTIYELDSYFSTFLALSPLYFIEPLNLPQIGDAIVPCLYLI